MNKKLYTNVISQMKLLGYSEYEARIYVGLLQNAPATAYEISKNTGVARANAYGSCENLVKKNAVQIIKDRPIRYVPVPPELLFAGILSNTKSLCESIAEGLKNLQPSIGPGYIWTLEGKSIVDTKVSQMIQGAKKNIWIKASSEVLQEHKPELTSALKSNRSLTCVIVLYGKDSKPFKFSAKTIVLLHEGSGARLGDADNLFTITIDNNEALTARMNDDVQAAYTMHEPIVTMAETLIRHDVYLAEIFLALGNQIEDQFGPHLRDLRKRYFNKKQYNHFLRNLQSLNV